jgi:hypothetical protein
MRRSTNRPSAAEPEIWFRILHVAADGRNGAPVATYREQTVEIALRSKGALEKGEVGTLTRRVNAERGVSAVPRARGKPTPARGSTTPGVV